MITDVCTRSVQDDRSTIARLLRAAAPACVLAIAPFTATAEPISENLKLIASDVADGDEFGGAVAVTESTSVVGAAFDDSNGLIDSGSAYVFSRTTSELLAKLTAADAADGDQFGWSVATSDAAVNTAVVGARRADPGGLSNAGAAYVFDVTTGSQLHKLVASDAAAGDLFGHSVEMSGAISVIGARRADHSGLTGAGAAYVFDADTGIELSKLIASDAAAEDEFGYAVAVSDNSAVIGARLADPAGLADAGAAYVFDTDTGIEIFKLVANDAAADDKFGFSVAVSGNLAVIGARRADPSGMTDAGAAYVFDLTTGLQVAKLTASDGAPGDEFGFSVAIADTTAIIGSRLSDGAGPADAGAVYIFDAMTGQELDSVTASDAAADDQFGRAVAAVPGEALIGAMFDDQGGAVDSGAVYEFDTDTGEQLVKRIALEGSINDQFGTSVALSDNAAVVGARFDDHSELEDAGSAYIYDVTTGALLSTLRASDAGELDQLGASVAAAGNTAVVGAPRNSHSGLIWAGSAYVFDVNSGIETRKLIASDASSNDAFGSSAAISGNIAVFGAPIHGHSGISEAGAAYVFDVTTGQQLSKLVASDASENDEFGTSVAVEANTVIVGTGSAERVYVFDAMTGQELDILVPSDAGSAERFGFSVAMSNGLALIGSPEANHSGLFDAGAAFVFDYTTGEELAMLTADDAGNVDLMGRSVAISGEVAIVGTPFGAGLDNIGRVYVFDLATGDQISVLSASDGSTGDSVGTGVAISGSTVIAGAVGDDHSGAADAGSTYVFEITLPCPADCDASGSLNLDDIDCFVSNFLASDLAGADCDNSGALNLDDLDCFVANFLAGCP